MFRYLLILIFLLLLPEPGQPEILETIIYPEIIIEKPVQVKRQPPIYEYAVYGTDIEAKLLRAIAIYESGEDDNAVSKDGLDIGRFQLRSLYDKERADKWGEFDVREPWQAGRIAALILQEHWEKYGNIGKILSAYNCGAGWVDINGYKIDYVEGVMGIYARL